MQILSELRFIRLKDDRIFNKLSELRFIRLKDDRIFNNVPGCISGLKDDSMQILPSFNPENLSSDKRIN